VTLSVVKTIQSYHLSFATGEPKQQTLALASLASIERAEGVVFLGLRASAGAMLRWF